ncbi:MAG: RNA methyltransferase [Thermosulfidibacteraceae bacterium]
MSIKIPFFYLLLVHYPVYNKRGKVVVSSITNLDIHDMARLTRTYEGKGFIMVTPLRYQQMMVERIVTHWKQGFGAVYNPNRDEALKLVIVKKSIEEAVRYIEEVEGKKPILVATSAKRWEGKNISYEELSDLMFESEDVYAIVLGTGWGLAKEVIDSCNYILDPIYGLGNYNHLSVRCAAAIIVDRLLGRRVGR